MKMEFWGVVCERDTDKFDPEDPPRGPLIMECYADGDSLKNACEAVERFRGKYGWAYVAKVTVDTDATENL